MISKSKSGISYLTDTEGLPGLNNNEKYEYLLKFFNWTIHNEYGHKAKSDRLQILWQNGVAERSFSIYFRVHISAVGITGMLIILFYWHPGQRDIR
jgi:hypothetical protein